MMAMYWLMAAIFWCGPNKIPLIPGLGPGIHVLDSLAGIDGLDTSLKPGADREMSGSPRPPPCALPLAFTSPDFVLCDPAFNAPPGIVTDGDIGRRRPDYRAPG